MVTRTELGQVLYLLATVGMNDGIYFDLLLGGLSHDQYEQLPGVHETLEPDENGTLVFAKDIHLPGGTVTVETSYERVAA